MRKSIALLTLLAGCSTEPSECNVSLQELQAKITTPYEVIYTDTLPRGSNGMTMRLNDGPAIVYVASDMNRYSREGALHHELCYHVLRNDIHPIVKRSNIATPDRGAMWDRIKMGAPQ